LHAVKTLKFRAMKTEHDMATIRKVVAETEQYQNDPEKFVRLFTSNVHLINVVGKRVEGRDELYGMMKKAVQTSLSEINTKNELLRIDFLKPDVALAKCIKHIFVTRNGQPIEKAKAALTFVLIKNDKRWMISSAQNTLMNEKAIQTIESNNIKSSEKHIKVITD